MNSVFLGASLSVAFFRELLARFLRNITAQLEAIEEPEPKTLFLASLSNEREDVATRLLDGETLVLDEDRGYFAESNEPRWKHDASAQRARERLTLARELLINVDEQTQRSQDWQAAQHWQDKDLPTLDYVTHVGELRSLLDVLAALGVDPHKEG